MKVKIEIDCNNAAFEERNNGFEVARILRYVVDHVEHEQLEAGGDYDLYLRDENGNRVGRMRVSK